LPFLGKWEGDSAEGVSLILTPTRELKFKISTDGDTLVYTYPSGQTLEMRVGSKDNATLDAQGERSHAVPVTPP
jgi:hypothetical protein